MTRPSLETQDYQRLLALRTGIRRFLHWSELQARAVGLTSSQHQLLLAVRGHDDPRGPTIGDVAGYLLLRHHSAVELVQRTVALGMLERRKDPDDRRVVRLALTEDGAGALGELSALHLEELARLATDLRPLWQGLEPSLAPPVVGPAEPDASPVRRPVTGAPAVVRARRIYEPRSDDDGTRVLVDRLWPRGMRKEEAGLGWWCREVAPSAELRRSYGHQSDRFTEFAERYRRELRSLEVAVAVDELVALARRGPVTLLTATKDLPSSGAAVLAEELLLRLG